MTKTLVAFLVFDRHRVKAMRLNKPALRSGDRCVQLRLHVPLSVFDNEIPIVDASVPEEVKLNGVTAAVDGPTLAALPDPPPFLPDPEVHRG